MIDFASDVLAGKFWLFCAALVFWVFAGPAPATAGNWRVVPIKINFDIKTRSEVVTVANDGDQALSLEVSAMEWSQDQNGQDVYQPATDLIFFPKQLVIEPKKERVIRAGVKVPAVSREKTYRLFIREVPAARQPAENAVAIAIQFGVPVFVAPPKAEIKGDIATVVIGQGQVAVTVKNQGNSHFRVSRVKLQGKTSGGEALETVETSGWYLLAGTQRTFNVDLPAELCRKADLLEVVVESDRITLTGSTDVDKAKCSAP